MDVILTWAKPMLEQYAAQYPLLFTVVVVMGSLRLFFKPVMTIIASAVKLTVTKKDDIFLEKVISSKWYKGFAFFVDWVASVKLPKKDK